jgi:hypothetical protein
VRAFFRSAQFVKFTEGKLDALLEMVGLEQPSMPLLYHELLRWARINTPFVETAQQVAQRIAEAVGSVWWSWCPAPCSLSPELPSYLESFRPELGEPFFEATRMGTPVFDLLVLPLSSILARHPSTQEPLP